jgi:hypothetical protein
MEPEQKRPKAAVAAEGCGQGRPEGDLLSQAADRMEPEQKRPKAAVAAEGCGQGRPEGDLLSQAADRMEAGAMRLRACNSSAICTAFVAAPLRRLSATMNRSIARS